VDIRLNRIEASVFDYMITKKCLCCKKGFVKKYTGKKGKDTKYCSRKCYHKSQIGKYKGKNHWSWKGDNIGYGAIHMWLSNNYGQPNTCEMCGLVGDSNINWALLKEKQYERNRENFWRLCDKCHIKYDGIKGKRFIKGQHPSPSTEFKKGCTPSNKGKKFVNGHYIL